MNGFGDCDFASTIYRDNGDADYLIVQGNRVSHVLAKKPDTTGMMRIAAAASSTATNAGATTVAAARRAVGR